MNEIEDDEVEEQEEQRVVVAVAAHRLQDEDRSVIREVLLVVAVVLIAAVLLWAWLSREDTGSPSVPPMLVGMWTTDNPEYSDRYLELRSDTITFSTGDTTFVTYAIIGVADGRGDDGRYYVIHYKGVDGANFRREIIFDASRNAMFFRSQPHVVWTKNSP